MSRVQSAPVPTPLHGGALRPPPFACKADWNRLTVELWTHARDGLTGGGHACLCKLPQRAVGTSGGDSLPHASPMLVCRERLHPGGEDRPPREEGPPARPQEALCRRVKGLLGAGRRCYALGGTFSEGAGAWSYKVAGRLNTCTLRPHIALQRALELDRVAEGGTDCSIIPNLPTLPCMPQRRLSMHICCWVSTRVGICLT